MKILFIIFSLFLIFGCGRITDQVLPKQETNKKTIEYYNAVIVGDSIANFIASATNTGNVSYLESVYGFPWTNKGMNGRDSVYLLSVWDDIISCKPKYLILNIGTNDIYREIDIEIIKQNLLYFDKYSYTPSVNMVINTISCTSRYGSSDENIEKNEIAKQINDWAKKNLHSKIVDTYSFSEDPLRQDYPRQDLYPDGLHPNNEGCKELVLLIYSIQGGN